MFSELEILSLEFSVETVFGVISGCCLVISLALRNCKKDCNILKIILIQVFCPLKTEIARFSIRFRLNNVIYFYIIVYYCLLIV